MGNRGEKVNNRRVIYNVEIGIITCQLKPLTHRQATSQGFGIINPWDISLTPGIFDFFEKASVV